MADRPLHGADSAEAWNPRLYRVQLRDTEGPFWWVTVTAIGPNDARSQARQAAFEQGADEPGVIAVVPA